MFERLQNAFSNVVKNFGEKELKEKDIDDILHELEITLLQSDVAVEVIDSIKEDLNTILVGSKVEKNKIKEFIRNRLIIFISKLFDDAGTVDILEKIKTKKQDSSDPFIILFVGVNGTGKTTTLAKLAHYLQKSKISIAIAAADTFRSGAIEQLREHTNRLNLKLIAQNYGADPAAVSRDAVLYAKSHKVDCVLIDTAGRMQTSKNLMEQIEKITSVVNPDMKIFVGDALAGNNTVNQAREFYDHVQFDASILTKSDADAKGGAALSIVKIISKPIIYIGVGQEYDDIEPFNKDVFLKTVFGSFDKDSLDKMTQDSTLESESTPKHKEKEKKEKDEAESFTPLTQETEISDTIHDDDNNKASADKLADSSKHKEQEEKVEPPPPLLTQKADKVSASNQTSNDNVQPSESDSLGSDDDPFEGIKTSDITEYSDLYDEPPPENNHEAIRLAKNIRKWISDGKPNPSQSSDTQTTTSTDKPKITKKKSGFFGRFKK
jgi:fused signal recognition particle receptor